MSLEDRKQWFNVQETSLPTATPEGQSLPGAADKLGHQYVVPFAPKALGPIMAGAYFTGRNAAQGTAITGHAAATAYDATKPSLIIRNGRTAAEGKYIVLDYIKMLIAGAGTNGTNKLYSLVVEPVNQTDRYSSGGTAATVINPNTNSTATSSAVAYAGAVVAAAASSSVRIVANGQIRSVKCVVGDTYQWNFGAPQKVAVGMPTEGTLQAHLVFDCPPIVLGPTAQFLLHIQAASESVAATFEYEYGYWEI